MKPLYFIIVALIVFACGGSSASEEQIPYQSASSDGTDAPDTLNSVAGGLELSQLNTYPQRVVLNGMPQHRLITIYKYIKPLKESRGGYFQSTDDYRSFWDEEQVPHFMPGIDLLYGYNLLNIAHYDMKNEKLNFLFPRPVLVKSLYYPSYKQDSVGKKPNRKPITRDYFLVSVYDEDTNGDTLLNRHDLRRLYHFNASCDVKTQLIPGDHSIYKSQYDFDNDVVYVYARQDKNKNGRSEETEPVHVFWIDLKAPMPAKRMY